MKPEIKDYIPENLIDYAYKMAGIRHANKLYCVPDQIARMQKLSRVQFASAEQKTAVLAYETVLNSENFHYGFFIMIQPEDLMELDPSILVTSRAAIGNRLFNLDALLTIRTAWEDTALPEELFKGLVLKDDTEYKSLMKNTNWDAQPQIKYLMDSGIFDLLLSSRENK